ncbi:MAG: hypothetical protein MJK14_07590, partial [Rivularia sp. ALOHA_DT_140]|nr:hypothetical protein [Rivularia sp. ALOHA_DT_140]
MTQMLREEVRERLGNIDQIRDIIFGAQIREYETRFGKLESDISLLQQEMRSHVEQLKISFNAELKAGFENLDKKLKLFNLNNEEEAADLRLSVDRLNRKFSSCIQSLDEELNSQTKSIREDVSQSKVQFEEEVLTLRDLVLEEIERRFSKLKQNKVSKDDMAEAFFNRADDAMLNLASAEEYRDLSSDDKLVECIMVWFEALSPYKPLVREILAYKLEPGHFHL